MLWSCDLSQYLVNLLLPAVSCTSESLSTSPRDETEWLQGVELGISSISQGRL